MNIELSEARIASVAELARVPITFTVDRVCDVLPSGNGLGGFVLSERPIETPYVKNYDGIPGEGPTQWARRCDISDWEFIRAQSKARRIGVPLSHSTRMTSPCWKGVAISQCCGTS